EYLSSAPKYNLLYESFGWRVPEYIHCSPVMRDARNKMSKRHGDPSYEDLVAEGYVTEAIVNYVALLGWSPGGEREIYSLKELAEVFDIRGISKSPAIFDIEKLKYFNSEYIRAMAPEKFHELALPYIRRAVKNESADTAAIAALLQPRCEKLSDIPEKIGFFDALPDYDPELYVHKKSKTDKQISLDMLKRLLPMLEQLPEWTQESIYALLVSTAEELGVKNSVVMWPLRIAVSGTAVTPGGAVEICRILGREESLARVRAGIELLQR
ncbi:MAG: glutamate--tRNA ligase, partial [Oscillospiraceae bacterium]|nr:glutamate--tRNA ligase [Oscillospiraceae bacterium]